MLLQVTYKFALPLIIKVLTPLHPGIGQTFGSVDLPVQRDTLGYPIIYSSSVKGSIRAAYRMKSGNNDRKLFGSESGVSEESYQGRIAVLDGILVAMPVRALNNVYLYVTSPLLIQRVNSYLEIMNALSKSSLTFNVKEENIASDNLEDLIAESYNGKFNANEEVKKLKEKLGLNKPLIVLKDNHARELINRSLLRVARVKLNDNKTVESGPWTEEYIPSNSVFFTVLLFKDEEAKKEIEEKVINNHYLFLGGKETTGKGLVKLEVLNLGGNTQ